MKTTKEKVVHTKSYGYWKKYLIEIHPNYWNPLTYFKFLIAIIESVWVLGYILPFKKGYIKIEYRDTTFAISGRI